MDIIKNFFKKKGLSFYFIAASFVFLLVSLIIYGAAGTTAFTPKLDPVVLTVFILSLIAAAVSLRKEYQALSFGVYALSFLAFLEYIISQVNYLAAILVAIDNIQFSAPFILTVVFSALAWISALVSAVIFSVVNRAVRNVPAAETAAA